MASDTFAHVRITQRLEHARDKGSAASRKVASYMLANLRSLPFETSASLAARLSVSESTIGRFCRQLDYSHFKALKQELRDDLGDSPWLMGERLQSFLSRSAHDAKERSLERTLAAQVELYEITRTAAWGQAVEWLATQSQVLVAGFQTERGVAISMAHLLQYIRSNVHVVDNGAGYFGDVLLVRDQTVLVVFDARRYSRWSEALCRQARLHHMPVILVTDMYCDWADEAADCVFRVQTDLDLFWESTAPMLTLAHLMINDVFARLGPDAQTRLEAVAALSHEFTGYTSAPAK